MYDLRPLKDSRYSVTSGVGTGIGFYYEIDVQQKILRRLYDILNVQN